MADDGGIVMNSEQFQTRLASFLAQWKADKRTGDAVFEGIGSIVIPVGKASDSAYTKTAAFQVSTLKQSEVIEPRVNDSVDVAIRLRIPLGVDGHHTRCVSHCSDQKER
jgi:hypothetical protein